MKPIGTLLLLFLFIHFSASAGDGTRRLLFISAGADFHLNKGDVTNDTDQTNSLSAANAMGARMGGELFWELPGPLFFATGIEFRTVRQKLYIKYDASEAGFTGSSVLYNAEIDYRKYYANPYARMGYAVPVSRNHLDISLGIATSISLSGMVKDDITALNITDPIQTDLAMYSTQSWGNQADVTFLPLNTLISVQLAYRIAMGKKNLRFGVDFSSGSSRKINRTEVHYFGPDRRYIGKSVFADRFQSVSILAGISL